MDAITLAMAKQYTNSQRLAYAEGGGSLTWDGNTEGLSAYHVWYRVSDKVYDASTVNALYLSDGRVIIPTTDNIVDVNGDGTLVVIGNWGMFVTVAQIYESFGYLDVGAYLYCNSGIYVSSITFKETIHPIDPKYLPGVCLPVVELTTAVTEDGAALTAEENATLDALGETPFVCRLVFRNINFSAIFNFISEESVKIYEFTSYVFGMSMILMNNNDGNGWVFMVENM